MTSVPDPVPLAPQAETTGITVVSLFPTRAKAEAAVRDLKRAGFSDQEIGVVMQDPGKPDLHPDAGESTSGAGLGAAAGGLAKILMTLGVPESDAEHFERGLRAGGILLTVSAAHRTADAVRIIESHEADLGPGTAPTAPDSGKPT